MDYIYTPSASCFDIAPVSLYKAELRYGDKKEEKLRIPENSNGEWGDPTIVERTGGKGHPLPRHLFMNWNSVTEGKVYQIDTDLDVEKMERLWQQQKNESPRNAYKYIVVGTAPYGGVAVWLAGERKSILLEWMKAEIQEEKRPLDNLLGSILPPEKMEQFMLQYNYRYVALEEYWDGKEWKEYDDADTFYDNIIVDSIEDKRFDGTRNYLGDITLQQYHLAGMPHRITMRWHEGITEYFVHFIINEYYLTDIFKRAYPIDTADPVDLLIRIDTRARIFQLALKPCDRSIPLIRIPFYCYRLIMFRNDIELFRSPDFPEEPGVWAW
jgi:hypothetical protein